MKYLYLAFLIIISQSTYAAEIGSNPLGFVEGEVIDHIPPKPFSNFHVHDLPGSNTGIQLTWTHLEDIINSFQVHRRTVGLEDEFNVIATVSTDDSTYIDTVNDSDSIYDYFVKAVDGNTAHWVVTDTLQAMAPFNDDDANSGSINGTISDSVTNAALRNCTITLTPGNHTTVKKR